MILSHLQTEILAALLVIDRPSEAAPTSHDIAEYIRHSYRRRNMRAVAPSTDSIRRSARNLTEEIGATGAGSANNRPALVVLVGTRPNRWRLSPAGRRVAEAEHEARVDQARRDVAREAARA